MDYFDARFGVYLAVATTADCDTWTRYGSGHIAMRSMQGLLSNLLNPKAGAIFAIRTVHNNLIIFVKRLYCLFHSGNVNGPRNMLRLVGPLSHHQAEIFLAASLSTLRD